MARYKVEILKHRITTEVYELIIETDDIKGYDFESIDESELDFMRAIDAEPHKTDVTEVTELKEGE